MDKQLLERFIAKYALGGVIESVIITSEDGKGIKTRLMTSDQNIVGSVQTSDIELEAGQYGVYNTSQLRSLLSVLEDDIKMKVVKTNAKPTGFAFSDKGTKVTFVLADISNFEIIPELKGTPDYEVVINIDDHFLNTFVKAKAALPDVETFTLTTDGKKAEIVIGLSSMNTNRVSFKVDTTSNEEIDPISFSAKYFREILLANKEMKSGTLRICSKGIAHATFVVDGFEVNYYMVRVERKD